jgi:predicted Zn finger-like uncharacterized protein
MGITKFTCPECGTSLQMAKVPAPGARIKCPKCHKSFDPAAALQPKEEVAELADESADEERRPRHKRHKLRKKSSSGAGVIIAVVVIGSVVAIGGGIGLMIYLWPKDNQQVAAIPPPQPRIPPNVPNPFEQGRPGPAPRVDQGDVVGRNPDRPAEPEKKNQQPTNPPNEPPPKVVPQGPRSLGFAQLNIARLNAGEPPVRAAAELDALNYLPNERGAIMGVDLQSLAGKLVLGWLTEKVASMHEEGLLDLIQRETSLPFRELDHVVAAGKLDLTAEHWKTQQPFPFDVHTYVVRTKNPYDRAKVLQQTNAGTAKRVQGKECFPLPASRLGRKAFLFLPADRIMVVSNVTEDKLGSIFAADGAKPRLSAAVLSTVRTLDKVHAWAVLSPEVSKQEPLAGLLSAAKLPTVELGTARALGIGIRFQGEQVKLNLALQGAGEAGGRGLTAALQEFWNKQGKVALENGKATFPTGWHGVAADVAQSLQMQNQADHCQATASVSFKAVDQLLKTLE